MSRIRIVTAQAPGLIPSLVHEIGRAPHPVVFIPESFTLACETEIVNRSAVAGIFGLKIFSSSVPACLKACRNASASSASLCTVSP